MKKLLVTALFAACLFPTGAYAIHDCGDSLDQDDIVKECLPDVDAAVFAFEGDVTLPSFPCAGAGCTATFTASIAGGLAVGDEGLGLATGLSATVTYTETCAGGQAVTGTAEGAATLSGTNVIGDPLPATAQFEWTRVGLVAVVRVHDGVGAAVFIPQGGLPTCSGGSLAATVAGAGVVLDDEVE